MSIDCGGREDFSFVCIKFTKNQVYNCLALQNISINVAT